MLVLKVSRWVGKAYHLFEIRIVEADRAQDEGDYRMI